MNKTEDLPAMYFTVLVIKIWQGPGPVATKMPFFFFAEIRISRKIFQFQPKKEFPSPFQSTRSAPKKASSFSLEIELLLPDFEALLAFL